VADRDAAAIAVLLGLLADIEQVEIVGGRREVEMHVDIDVELARDLEDAVDLPVRASNPCRARRRPRCRRS
jgi:hypothetical protein